MEQRERKKVLIKYLINENTDYKSIKIPQSEQDEHQLLRGLMNVRMPKTISKDFLKVQDEYLSQIVREKGVVNLSDTEKMEDGIYLWQGDITRLGLDAIVNAANSGMTGCYNPNHNCIDNCIHTFGGIQMRLECAEIMEKQGFAEPTGRAKITSAYNLPSKYVIHTVGPIISGRVTREDEELLRACYRSCLETAAENGVKSIAFCCISTGVFCFPNQRAAEIAVETVREYRAKAEKEIEVLFNVFKDEDYAIYRKLLG